MIAHGSGIDDLVLTAVGVVLFVGLSAFRRRPRRGNGDPDLCSYCDEPVPAGAVRCDACGFRIRR